MRSLRTLIFTGLILTVAPSATFGVIVSWDATTTDTTYETGTNWVGGAAPTDDLTTDVAQFAGGTVDLSSARQVGGLDFTVGTTLSGGGNIEIGTSGIAVGGNSTIGTGLTFNQANTNINVSGGDLDITGQVFGSGNVTVSGSGEVHTHFNTNDTSFTGNYTVNSGATLRSERHSLRLSGGGGTITLDGGTVTADGDHLDLAGRDVVLTANGGTLQHAHARNVFGNFVVSGPGQLTVSGGGSTAGRMQLQGANTHTGGTRVVNGGQAWAYSDASFGAAGTSITLDTGGTYFAANGLNISRAIILDGAGRVDTSNKNTTFSGTISGTGSLEIVSSNGSPGTLTITSAGNTYSGGTTIGNGGVVRHGNFTGALGTGTVTLDGGELYGNDHMNLSGNPSIVLGPDGGSLRHRHARNIFGLGGVVISGSGALSLNGETTSGRIQMEGTNTYTGGTIFNSGTVRVNSNAALGDAAGSITFSGGTMQNNNSNVDLGNRAIEVDADGGIIVAGWTNRRITSDGVISGVGKLTIANDSSTVRFGGGSNTYSGGTDVNGTLWAKTGSLGTGVVTLNNSNVQRGHLKNYEGATTNGNNIIIGPDGGTLSAGWSSDHTLGGVVSGTGNLRIEGDSGTVVLGGTNTFTGPVQLLDSDSRLKVTGSLGSGSYAGTISGDGTFEYAGSGMQTLSGNSTYTGTSTVSSGTLYVNGDNSAATGAFSVANGATLGGNGTIGGETTVAGILNPGNSPGTLTFNEALTLESTATLNLEFVSTSSFDVLRNDGGDTLTVDGVLALDSSGYLSPTAGDSFLVFENWGSLSGTFSSIIGLDLGGGLTFDTSNLLSTGVISVVAVPEASQLLALSAVAIGCVLRRKSQRHA